MKPLRRIVGTIMFLLACTVVQANKPPAPPDDNASLSGIWTGPLSATLHPYIRLELDASGKGLLFLPSCTPAKEISIYRVLGTTFSQNFKVKFSLEPVDPTDAQPGDTMEFTGTLPLTRAGSFGYNVRVIPQHPMLASAAEMGLVAFGH